MAGTPPAEVSVSPDLVRALIADQHPHYAYLPVRLVGEGYDNFTFRLGDDLAVRLPRRAEALECLASEQGWLSKLPPLPVPISVPIATGGPGHGFPWPWSIIPWITGAPVDKAPLNADQGPALAAFLKALHQPAPHDAPNGLPFVGHVVAVPAPRVGGARALHQRMTHLDRAQSIRQPSEHI